MAKTKKISGIEHEIVPGGKISDATRKKWKQLKEWHEEAGGTKHPLGTIFSDEKHGYVANGYDWLKFDINSLSKFRPTKKDVTQKLQSKSKNNSDESQYQVTIEFKPENKASVVDEVEKLLQVSTKDESMFDMGEDEITISGLTHKEEGRLFDKFEKSDKVENIQSQLMMAKGGVIGEFTAAELLSKYKGKYIDVYKKDDDKYELRGVSNKIRENYNLPEDAIYKNGGNVAAITEKFKLIPWKKDADTDAASFENIINVEGNQDRAVAMAEELLKADATITKVEVQKAGEDSVYKLVGTVKSGGFEKHEDGGTLSPERKEQLLKHYATGGLISSGDSISDYFPLF